MSNFKYMAVCPDCDQYSTRNDKYDAYACLKCNKWLEVQCSDKHCNFCKKRPEKPSYTDYGWVEEND